MADDSAASGGLLVVLGIVVAVGLGIFFFRGDHHISTPSAPSVNVEVPSPTKH